MREILKSARIAALPAIMAVALSAFTLPSAAQAPNVIPICTPTEEAMQACVASGGKMNTLTCQCETPISKPTQPCAVVCPEAGSTPRHCRCITDH